jgi:uncharacterized protein (TIGR02246 family)
LTRDPGATDLPAVDRAAIEQTLAAFLAAWNAHDAHAFSLTFATDADFTNVMGVHARGRTAVESFHAPAFATVFKTSHLTGAVRSVRSLTPTLAAVDVDWQMTGMTAPNGTPRPSRTGLIDWIMEKQSSGNWLILVMHNTDLPPGGPGAGPPVGSPAGLPGGPTRG